MNMNSRDKVVGLLKKNNDGLTIVDIAKLLKLSRNTVAVALAGLVGARFVRVRPIGVAKLHYWVFEGRKK